MEKYRRLLKHIGWLQALAADVEKMGASKLSSTALDGIDRRVNAQV